MLVDTFVNMPQQNIHDSMVVCIVKEVIATNLLSNHGNQHLDITYQPWNRGYFVVACLQRYPLPL